MSERKPGTFVSNSFTADQVSAVVRLFRKLDTPTNRDLLNNKEVRAVQGKFLRMAEKLDATTKEG